MYIYDMYHINNGKYFFFCFSMAATLSRAWIILLITIFELLETSHALLKFTKQTTCKTGPLDELLEGQCLGGHAYWCNNTGINHVPKYFPTDNTTSKLCLLDLSENNLTHIYDNSFTTVPDVLWLYLFKNNISRIDSNAFKNLNNLLYLNLTSNQLHLPDSFGEGVFSHVTNLRYINLKDNPINTYNGLQILLSPLKKLESLFILGCNDCIFEKGFENFTNLKNVSLSQSGSGETVCNISVLLNNAFVHLPQIYNLFMSSCKISKVESLAFRPLQNIQSVDISYNPRLHFNEMRNVLWGLKNTPVSLLNFNHIYEYFETGTVLTSQQIEPIKYMKNLTTLHMDLNKLEIIEAEVFKLLPKSLTTWTLSGNRLTYGKYVEKLSNMKHIHSLDISRQHLMYDPFSHEHYESTPHLTAAQNVRDQTENTINETTLVECYGCLSICKLKREDCLCLPPMLETLKWRKSFLNYRLQSFRVCPPSSLKKLEISFNLINEWIGPVYGVENLQELNLAENYCQNMSAYFFDSFYNLTKLNVTNNFLGPLLNMGNKDAGKHFKNLTKLQILDLSENRITTFSNDIFQNLRNLRYLNISKNMLSQWNSKLTTKCLQELNLSGNRLTSLPEAFRTDLDMLSDYDSCNRTTTLTLDLSNNPIQCSCDNRPFLRWLAATPINIKLSDVDLTCLKKKHLGRGNNRADISDLVKRLDEECFPYVSIIVSTSMCILSVTFGVLIYRYRWKLRHLYFSKRKRHRNQGYNRLFERDAFISYSKSECGFIKNSLVPVLEDLHDLSVWVADRDSQAGASVAENLTHAINNCKKSVLLFSKNYFTESWCNYEMNMARVEAIESKRKLFIIVLLADVDTKDVPLDYMRLLQSEGCVEYPSHPQDLETFWADLAEEIRRN